MAKKVITNARVKNSLYKQMDAYMEKQNITGKMHDAIEEHGIKKGIVKEIYHYLDQSLVELSNGKLVKAWHLHRCFGSIVDMYTPYGQQIISETEHEPCIIPRETLKCLVAEVGKEEYVLLGYYNPEMTGIFNPAEAGHYLIRTMSETSHGGLDISPQEIVIQSNNGASFVEQDVGQSTPINYANSSNTYTKDDLYTRAQVEKMIKEIWDYIDPEGDTDG